MSERKERPSRKILRSRIEKQLQRQREEQRRELLRKRIEIAKDGVRLSQEGRVIESIKRYQQYILILEMWKKCGRDGLRIELFDRTKDLYEIVLLSGIYWDMAKLYDQAKTKSQREELKLSLDKYVNLSKGMPFQALSGEAIRRYLGSGRCRHRPEFKAAYVALTGERCFIATALIDVTDPATIPRLRAFRDLRLRRFKAGRAFIKAYYAHSRKCVPIVDAAPEPVRKALGKILDVASHALTPRSKNDTDHRE
jgi:hypothetical protein